MAELTDKLIAELIDSVKQVLKREASERLRELYLVGDIDKDVARHLIERLRELANDSPRPVTIYLNTAGGNVTDGLAIHDAIREVVPARWTGVAPIRAWPWSRPRSGASG